MIEEAPRGGCRRGVVTPEDEEGITAMSVMVVCEVCKQEGFITDMHPRGRGTTGRPRYRCETCFHLAKSGQAYALVPGAAVRFYDAEKDMYCLTAMWRAAGGEKAKQPSNWFDWKETRDFLAKLRVHNPSEDGIIATRGRNGGTWGHWQVAVAYAKYLSPEFHIQWNEYAAAYLRGEQIDEPVQPLTPEPAPIPSPIPALPSSRGVSTEAMLPANDYAALLGHVTQTGESIITLRNHLSLTEQWLNNLPSVVEALEDQLESLRPLADAVKKRRNPLKHGWIYVLHDPVGRRYKIGMTQNADPGKRKAEVEGQWGKGQSIQVVWIETDDVKLEKAIHAYYKQRRLHIREEWYRLSDEDVNRIRALGSFVSFKDFQPESLDVVAVVQGGLFGLQENEHA